LKSQMPRIVESYNDKINLFLKLYFLNFKYFKLFFNEK